MKKSELRNIIRESIKELMGENTQPNPNARLVRTVFCDGSHESIPSTIECSTQYPNVPHFANAPVGTLCAQNHNTTMFHNMTIGGNVPQLGDVFNFNTQLNGITNFPGGIGQITGNPGFFDSWVGDHVVVYVGSASTNTTQVDFSSAAACPPFSTTTSAGSCNPAAWSNHSTWTSTFTNTVANHNNPCNFLNQKIAQFTANLQGTGQGNYQNMQNCKLDLANQLHTQNNC